MSRKYLFPLIGVITAAMLTGCGSQNAATTEVSTEAPEETAIEDVAEEEYADTEAETETETELPLEPIEPASYLMEDTSDYITLGTYTGVEAIQYTYEVTDDMVQEYIDSDLMMYSEENEVDRASEDGDTVYVDLSYTAEGEDTATEESTYFVIGEEECGPEFDEKLTGVSAEDTLEFTITFDDSIWNEEWAGQTMDFNITVTGVWESVTPEYNEEFVQDTLGYSSVEEYETTLRDSLISEYETQSYYDAVEMLFETVAQQSVISECPEEFLTACQEEVETSYAVLAGYFGVEDLEEALELFGLTEEDIEAEAAALAERRLLVNAICIDAGIEVTEDEYFAYLEELAEANGYDSASLFEQDYTRDSIVWELFEQKAGDLLYENADIQEEAYTGEGEAETEILEDALTEEAEAEIPEDALTEEAETEIPEDALTEETETEIPEDALTEETETEILGEEETAD